jgi:hypothetical protein
VDAGAAVLGRRTHRRLERGLVRHRPRVV